MLDLTVIILTKNEEQNIAKCIGSFGNLVKRFVIVDSHSTDRTEAVCSELGKKIISGYGGSLSFYEHDFQNQAQQFDWAVENTEINTMWVMRMDADEELMPALCSEMERRLPDIKENVNGIVLKRRTYFMRRWIRHGGRYPEYLLRIFRRGKGHCEQRIMDEHLVLTDGDTVTFDNDLIDNNTKDLEWWTAKHNWYSNREVLDLQLTLAAEKEHSQQSINSTKQARRKRNAKNHGYYRLPMFMRAHWYFIYRYYFRLGFLDGTEGKIYHFLQAYWYRFLVDAKMYECDKNGKQMDEQGDLKA